MEHIPSSTAKLRGGFRPRPAHELKYRDKEPPLPRPHVARHNAAPDNAKEAQAAVERSGKPCRRHGNERDRSPRDVTTTTSRNQNGNRTLIQRGG